MNWIHRIIKFFLLIPQILSVCFFLGRVQPVPCPLSPVTSHLVNPFIPRIARTLRAPRAVDLEEMVAPAM
jgi:hypothetical protein